MSRLDQAERAENLPGITMQNTANANARSKGLETAPFSLLGAAPWDVREAPLPDASCAAALSVDLPYSTDPVVVDDGAPALSCDLSALPPGALILSDSAATNMDGCGAHD